MITYLTLIALFAASWAIVSVLAFRHDRSIFDLHPVYSFFGKHASTRKYSDEPLYERNWYHRALQLHRKEKFFLSSTVLVFLTDAYHLFQFLAVTFAILSAIALPQDDYSIKDYVVIVLITKAVWAGVFMLLFHYVLLKDQYRFKL